MVYSSSLALGHMSTKIQTATRLSLTLHKGHLFLFPIYSVQMGFCFVITELKLAGLQYLEKQKSHRKYIWALCGAFPSHFLLPGVTTCIVVVCFPKWVLHFLASHFGSSRAVAGEKGSSKALLLPAISNSTESNLYSLLLQKTCHLFPLYRC